MDPYYETMRFFTCMEMNLHTKTCQKHIQRKRVLREISYRHVGIWEFLRLSLLKYMNICETLRMKRNEWDYIQYIES